MVRETHFNQAVSLSCYELTFVPSATQSLDELHGDDEALAGELGAARAQPAKLRGWHRRTSR